MPSRIVRIVTPYMCAYRHIAQVLELVQDMLEGGSHIAVCKDLSAPKEASRSSCPPPCLNTGTMIVRRSSWSREFLRTWWEAAERDGLGAFRQGRDHEESVLAALFKNNELQVRNKTLVLSPAQLNSIPPYFKDHNLEQAVMHLSDTPNAVRERVLQRLASGLHVIEDGGDRKLTTLHLPSDLEAISMEAFREVWHSGSTDVRVALALSAAARDGGDQDEWLRLLEAALGLAPHDPDVVLAFASALAAVSHWCQAAGIFLKAARLVCTCACFRACAVCVCARARGGVFIAQEHAILSLSGKILGGPIARADACA